MHFEAWYAKPLIVVTDLVNKRLRMSPWIAQRLFGVDIQRGDRKQLWDYTTLALKKALAAYARPRQRVLEIGVGENATLAIFLAKHFPVTVVGVEIVPEIVTTARASVARNGVSVDIRESDMFSSCDGQFDLIFWNIPYVPRRAQEGRLGLAYADVAVDGGVDGTDVISRFLNEAPPHLTAEGRALLGVNTFYLRVDELRRVVDASPFALETIVGTPVNPSKVLVLRVKDA